MAMASNILPEQASEETFARRDLPEDIQVFKLDDGGVELVSPKGGRVVIKAENKTKTSIREAQTKLREGDARGGYWFGGDAQEGILDSFISSPSEIVRKFKSIFDEDMPFQDPVKFSPGLMPGASARSAVTFSDKGLREIWLKDRPGWKNAHDVYGNLMVKNKKTGQVRYVNPEGFGAREINKIFGDIIAAAGVGKVASAAGSVLSKAPVLKHIAEPVTKYLSGPSAMSTGLREAGRGGADAIAQNALAKAGPGGSESTNLTDYALLSAGAGGLLGYGITGVANTVAKRSANKEIARRTYLTEGSDSATSPLAAGARLEDLATKGQRYGKASQLKQEAGLLRDAEGNLLGSRTFGKRVIQDQPAALNEALLKQMPGAHMTPEVAGEQLKETMENAFSATDRAYRVGVNLVENSGNAAAVQIPSADVAGMAKDLRAVLRKPLINYGTKFKSTMTEFENLLKSKSNQPVTFQDLIDLRRLVNSSWKTPTAKKGTKVIDKWIKNNLDRYPNTQLTRPTGGTASIKDLHVENQKMYAAMRSNWNRSQNPLLKKIAEGKKIGAKAIANNIISPSPSGVGNSLAALDMLEKEYPKLFLQEIKPSIKGGMLGKITGGKDIMINPLTMGDYKVVLRGMDDALESPITKKILSTEEFGTLSLLRDRLKQIAKLPDTTAKKSYFTFLTYGLRRIFSYVALSSSGAAMLGGGITGGPIGQGLVGAGLLLGAGAGAPIGLATARSSKALAPPLSAMARHRLSQIRPAAGLLGREAVRPPVPGAVQEEIEGLL